MQRRGILLLAIVVAGALAFGASQAWLGLRVAAGYAAKLTCSLSLNSKLTADLIQSQYLDYELAPVSHRLTLNPADCCARASFLFEMVQARAVHRPGLGCTSLAGCSEEELGMPEGLTLDRPVLDASTPWPAGEGAIAAPAMPAVEAAIDRAFAEPATSNGGPRQTKAVLIVHDGRLVAERYAEGYDHTTRMLSWSMAKSVLAAVVGIAVADGKLALQGPASVPDWSAPDDARHAITLDQLLRMSSGLEFDETYGAVNDVSRMLFLEPDMGAFAAAKPLAAAPDGAWSYSSGTSNIISRMLRDSFGGDFRALARYVDERLFAPAAITTAFFEPDVSGTPVGSSFVFMTARDWARFGELHRNDGVQDGRRILPEGWVRYVTTPTPRAPLGEYGGHWWLNAGKPSDATKRPWPSLPTDAYAARGHSGQWVLVIPSAKLVIVRLGLSFPDDGDDGTIDLATDVIAALSR